MQFQTRRRFIEANQFHHGATAPIGVRTREDGSCYTKMLGVMEISVEYGDWIILEPNTEGQLAHPCKPAIFNNYYEPTTQPEPQKQPG